MKLPASPPKYDPANEAQTRAALERADGENVKKRVAQDGLYLRATDDGSTMKLTVTSAGVMTWTQVART